MSYLLSNVEASIDSLGQHATICYAALAVTAGIWTAVDVTRKLRSNGSLSTQVWPTSVSCPTGGCPFMSDGEQSWPLPTSSSLASGGCLQAQVYVHAPERRGARADCQCTCSFGLSRKLTAIPQGVIPDTHSALVSQNPAATTPPRKTAFRCITFCAWIRLHNARITSFAVKLSAPLTQPQVLLLYCALFPALPSAGCIIGRPRDLVPGPEHVEDQDFASRTWTTTTGCPGMDLLTTVAPRRTGSCRKRNVGIRHRGRRLEDGPEFPGLAFAIPHNALHPVRDATGKLSEACPDFLGLGVLSFLDPLVYPS